MARMFRSGRVANDNNRAEMSGGYAANGISMHSRDAAHSGIVLNGYTPGLRKHEAANRDNKRGRPGALLLKTEDQLAELRTKLKYVSGDKRARIEKSIDIKTKFVIKLRDELTR
jgi:hypothetical protein